MKTPGIIILPPNRVWRTYLGGKTLDTIETKTDPSDSHFPEDWIASTTHAINAGREEFVDEGLSKIIFKGGTQILKEVMERFPEEILGREHYRKYGANTQFLLKFLDSATRLHIQAHPTIEFAKKHLNSNSGKTEGYVILGTRDDSGYVYLGFQHPIPKDAFRKAVMEQDVDAMLSCFDKIPVRQGDVFIVPGGLPHAIGEGVFMIEIMEPTDFVVRLEFERGGYVLPEAARFMGRDVDFALSMIDFTPHSVERIRQNYFCEPRLLSRQNDGEETILIDKKQTPCFSVHRLTITGNYVKNADTFYVGIVTKGSGTVLAGEEREFVKTGDRFLIPFNTHDVEYVSDREFEIVLTFPPE